MSKITDQAQNLMRIKTEENGAPFWDLTVTAVTKGRELAELYNVDSEVVELALWLAHICFSNVVGDEIQKNHTKLSADLAKQYLAVWGYPEDKAQIVYESILGHHSQGVGATKVAEVMKNAECYKFISWPKLKLYYEDLLTRGYEAKEAEKLVRLKFEQKEAILTFTECIADANNAYPLIDGELKALAKVRTNLKATC